MQPPSTENGWEAQSGYAPFEKDGNKGVVLLITSSGFEQMVNIVILTNTDVYKKNINQFLESVAFKKPRIPNNQTNNKAKPVSNGFQFTTTNFDDGWTSTVQEDWVQVTKGNIKVLIHYPNKQADAWNASLLDGLKNAWNILVAPRYSSANNMEFKPLSNWEAIEFAEADMVENTTGQNVHVVFFRINSNSGRRTYLEFITPDKNTFEQEFGPYHQSSSGWDKMVQMANYNRFAVAASDLAGKWTSDFSGAIQYVNAFTGFDAGMDTHASKENFQFNPGGNYTWDLGVASGAVGNIKFQSRNSRGNYSMNGNWQLSLSDIEGKPRTYNVQFSCIKGLRVLWIDGRAFAKKE
jgi:hypothetical protein